MQMNLDIIVAMRCPDLHINVQDASGDRILASELLQRETTQWSTWVGPGRRYQAEDWRKEQAVQYSHEEDVHDYLGAARKGRRKFPSTPMARRGGDESDEACRIFGSLEGNKVQGDFHITARGHGYMEFGEHLDHGRTWNTTHPSQALPLATTIDQHHSRFQLLPPHQRTLLWSLLPPSRQSPRQYRLHNANPLSEIPILPLHSPHNLH